IKEELLPLANHTQVLIIKNGHLNRYLFSNSSGQLLNVHLNATITGNVEDRLIRSSHFSSNCCRKTITHCAQSTRRKELPGILKLVVLGSPHLILSNLSHHYSIAFSYLID